MKKKNNKFEGRIEDICKAAGLTDIECCLTSQAADTISEAISIASEIGDMSFIKELGKAYANAYADMYNFGYVDMDDYPFDMAKDYISNHS